MRWFSKQEIIVITLIFLLVGSVTGYNLGISIRRARDVQRRGDLSAVADALEKFYSEYKFFPPSEGGKIKFCKASNFDTILSQVNQKKYFDKALFFQGLRPCEWGQDAFEDIINGNETYMKTLPSDPKNKTGISYDYLSNTGRYQIYSYLEGQSSEIGYDTGIVKRGLVCGNVTCSFGKSYADTPLNISIEQYEAELLQKRLNK